MGLILLDNALGGGFSNIRVGTGGGMGVGAPAPSGGGTAPPEPDLGNLLVSSVDMEILTKSTLSSNAVVSAVDMEVMVGSAS